MRKGIALSIAGLFLFCPLLWADLTENGDGTVTDTATGLMWQQAEGGAMTWEEALRYCENYKLAGYDDWRLPNVIELQSIVDYDKMVSENEPAIDTAFFASALAANYWSATTYADSTDNAWFVAFNFGFIDTGNKTSRRFNVRAVRGGL